MNIILTIAGILTLIAALLHLGCIYFGAPWYRFFGAGEHMAQLAIKGSSQPTIITLGIFTVLTIWSLYAFSAAGLISKLPLQKLALIVITTILTLRGIAGFFFVNMPMGRSPEFWVWSSIICLVLGVSYLVGSKQVWQNLS